MTDKKNLKLVAQGEKTTPQAPTGGGSFESYSLADYLQDEDMLNWASFFGREDRSRQLVSNPRRSQRQNGKILEAQEFRKMQGAFLKARLHAITMAQDPAMGLRWWFSNSDRITLHHLVMSNYYLHDTPTPEDEIKATLRCTSRTVRDLLRTAVQIGSLDPQPMAEDGRRKCYYPTRGLVSDTDNFFGSTEVGREGVFAYLNQMIIDLYGEERYSLKNYQADFAEFHRLIAQLMKQAEKSR
jgi:hypothetical protein